MKIAFILIQILLPFIPKGPVNNKSTLIKLMAFYQTSHKPLSESMTTQFTDAYIYI